MEETNQGQQQNESSKTRQKFEKTMKQLVAVLSNPDWFKRDRIGSEELSSFLSRATESKKEALYKEFESKLNTLIEKKAAYDKLIKQKEKEFLAAVEAEQKKFIAEAEGLLALVEDAKTIERRYYETLTSIPSPLGTTEESAEEPPPAEETNP